MNEQDLKLSVMLAETRQRLGTVQHFLRLREDRIAALREDLAKAEVELANAEVIARALVEVICADDRRYGHVARALYVTVAERNDAWRRVEQARRVIESIRVCRCEGVRA